MTIKPCTAYFSIAVTKPHGQGLLYRREDLFGASSSRELVHVGGGGEAADKAAGAKC